MERYLLFIYFKTFTIINMAAAAAKLLQSCPTLCDPIDGSPPGSPVPGILQARMLEWVAISFSNAWKWKEKVKSLSHVQPSATPWTAAYQAPLPMEFSRQEYWSGVPLPSPINMAVFLKLIYSIPTSSQVALVIKNLPANVADIRDMGLIPGLGKSPGEGNGNPLQYSCLENPMDRGAWRATVHSIIWSQTQLKRLSTDLPKISVAFLADMDKIILHYQIIL